MAYLEFGAELRQDKSLVSVPSESAFRDVFKDCVKDMRIQIRIRKNVAKCETCSSLRSEINNVGTGAEKRQELLTKILHHKKFVRGVRRAYYDRRDQATEKPGQYASLIIGLFP